MADGRGGFPAARRRWCTARADRVKRLLLVAFHFPPLAGSSGIQRTLRLAQQLPAFGWEPLVLTASPLAYEATSDDLLQEVPPGLVVERAFALDTRRHLSLFNRYPGVLARPDRWLPWRFGAVRAGMGLVRHHAPSAIWSTFPIATAHLIGQRLHERSGLPWIADFRDPMAQEGYPEDPLVWRSYKAIEERAMRSAARVVVTTPGCARLYRDRYPGTPADHIAVIENGYDEDSFAAAEAGARAAGRLDPQRLVILHSGIVYPSERDPICLFAALAQMKERGAFTGQPVVVRFRAAVHEALLHDLARRFHVQDLVEVVPATTYRGALEEMLRADVLLVLQAANCNQQIPAKLYEYLRARRPIIALTDPAGDTAGVLERAGLDSVAPLDSADAIVRLLSATLERVRAGRAALPSPASVEGASRLARTRELVRHLEEIAGAARV